MNGVPTPALSASLLGVIHRPGARGSASLNHVGGALIWSVWCEDGRYDTWVVHESLVLTPLLSRTASPVSALVEMAGGHDRELEGLGGGADLYTAIGEERAGRR